jgi:hypothetical protein
MSCPPRMTFSPLEQFRETTGEKRQSRNGVAANRSQLLMYTPSAVMCNDYGVGRFLFLGPAEQFSPRRNASFFNSAFCVPSGMERLSASTSSATGGEDRSVVGGKRGVTILQPALDRPISVRHACEVSRCALIVPRRLLI